MPALKSDKLGLMIDTGGCPNRCVHCSLAGKPTRQMSYPEMRWIVEQFRTLQSNGRPRFNTIEVGLWCMEPDFREDYRSLWDLERELSDVDRKHGGLLSIWRILRDDTYLSWVKEKGGTCCQITLFGAGETHDRFMGRGAFDECIEVMRRLVAAEVAVQWLMMFTKAIVPDLEALLGMAVDLRLVEESARLGCPWGPTLADVDPVGRGWHLEHLRPSVDNLDRLPESLRDRDRTGYGERTEAECVRLFLGGEAVSEAYETLWLQVDASFNVFPQFGDLAPWYCLGNLRHDGAERIMEAYLADQTPGQHTRFVIGPRALAEQYGDPKGTLLYTPTHLLHRWIGQHCRAVSQALR